MVTTRKLLHVQNVTLREVQALQAAQDAAEEAQSTALVGGGEVEAAEHEAQVVFIGSLHVSRRVVGGEHDLLNETGEDVEIAGGGTRSIGRGWPTWGFSRGAGADGEFIETDRGGLAEVHGGLAGVGGDLDEVVTEREVFAGEAVFFGAEDEGDSAGRLIEFAGDDGGELVEENNGLFSFAMSQRAGAEDERAVANGLGKSRGLFGDVQKFGGTDSGAGFTPVRLVGGDRGEMGEAEVGHGARDGADVEGVARRDEDDGDAVAL